VAKLDAAAHKPLTKNVSGAVSRGATQKNAQKMHKNARKKKMHQKKCAYDAPPKFTYLFVEA
jgi:hypothetical protein